MAHTIHSFRLNWLQAGERLDARIFHTTNILLHLLVTLLLPIVVRLYRLLAPDRDSRGRSGGRGVQIWGLMATGVLFGVHPIHCEAVAGLVGTPCLVCHRESERAFGVLPIDCEAALGVVAVVCVAYVWWG